MGPDKGRAPNQPVAPKVIDFVWAFKALCKPTYETGAHEKMPMSPDQIPSLIKELRTRLKLTQEQFAQEVGVTYSTVNHWENGKRVPLPFLLRRLLEIKEELDQRDRKPRRRTPE